MVTALAAGVLLYVGYSVWAGFAEIGEQLSGFRWGLYAPVLLLTLGNYALRFAKWHWLMRLLGVRISVREDAAIFTAGLAMVISPAKAGELLKPYLVSRRTGVPMATTIPALVAERLTDGIAMLALAAFSIGTYAADRVAVVAIPAALVAVGLLVLSSSRLSKAALSLLARLPGMSRIAPKLEQMYQATRRCLAPGPLLVTVALSVLAWWLECAGFVLVFQGLGATASLDACTFLYAFATIAGGASPGGLGIADTALVALAVPVLAVERPLAVAASLLIRVATLWFGVLLGAIALFRFEDLLGEGLAPGVDKGGEGGVRVGG